MKKILLIIIFLTINTIASDVDENMDQEQNVVSNEKQSHDLKTLYFDYSKPTVINIQDLKNNIKIIKDLLKKDPETKFVIEGYSGRNFEQPFERKEHRFVASYIRAKAVIDELMRHGLPADIFKLVPKGINYSKYIPFPDEDEASFSKRNQPDRRVVIKVFKPEEFTPGSDISGLKG